MVRRENVERSQRENGYTLGKNEEVRVKEKSNSGKTEMGIDGSL